jgi:tetratricopeptide (TPR) repeat protein
MNLDFLRPPLPPRPVVNILPEIESAQLVRRAGDDEPSYLFKHALVQDSAYTSLTRHERRRLHRLVAQTLEEIHAARLDENAALLAYHYERAEEWGKALEYLQRAAEWARRGAAYREQADLLKRSIELAGQANQSDVLATLYAQRGQALLYVAEWRSAVADLDIALERLPHEALTVRAQVLIDLANAYQLLWDVATSTRYAQEALTLAERANDEALVAAATAQLAFSLMSDERTHEAIAAYERIFGGTRRVNTTALARALEFYGTALYWVGDYDAALRRNQEALAAAETLADHVTIVRAHSNLAAALAARGSYREALENYHAAQQLAAERKILPWHARALSMEGGIHLDLFDYGGAEELAVDARRIARRAPFPTAYIGTGIDLIFNYTRRGELKRADALVREVAEGIPAIYGSHRWLWEIRFLQARAELALVRQQDEAARVWAEEAHERSRATGRRKYEVLALLTRAHARFFVERSASRQDARDALDLARQLDEPILVLRAALVANTFGDRDALIHARAARRRILAGLPEGNLKERFDAVVSEWI